MKLTQAHGRMGALQFYGLCGCFLLPRMGGINMESIKQTIERLRIEVEVAVDTEVRKRKRAEQLHEHCLQELNEANRKVFARFNDEECWIYQSDGENYFESLVCPIVISKEDLKDLINKEISAFIQHCLSKQDPDDCLWCLEDVEKELKRYDNQLREQLNESNPL